MTYISDGTTSRADHLRKWRIVSVTGRDSDASVIVGIELNGRVVVITTENEMRGTFPKYKRFKVYEVE